MKKRNSIAAMAAAAVLTACGGGGDSADPALAFQQAWGAGISQPANASAQTSATYQDTFAANYLDAGVSRAQLVDALNKEAAAVSASADFTGSPAATLTDVNIGACNANGVCTLTATLTNADADSVSVPFTTQVVQSGGVYRLLGDQQSS